MDINDTNLSRRALFAATAVGGLASLAVAGPAEAAAPAPAEQANIKRVKDFIAGWTRQTYDVAALIHQYITPKCSVRMFPDQPPMTSDAQVIAAFEGFMKDGSWIKRVDYHDIFAKGPVVVTVRTDVLVTPGKPDTIFKVVGVFLVKAGKIEEWSDFLEA